MTVIRIHHHRHLHGAINVWLITHPDGHRSYLTGTHTQATTARKKHATRTPVADHAPTAPNPTHARPTPASTHPAPGVGGPITPDPKAPTLPCPCARTAPSFANGIRNA